MKSYVPKISGNLDLHSEIIVPASWAEREWAKGILQLTSVQIKQLEKNSTIRVAADLFYSTYPPIKDEFPIDWIEPLAAVHLLSPRLGGDAAAKSAIAERLRDGAIVCTHVWLSSGPDIGPISDERPRFPSISSGVQSKPWITPITQRSELNFVGSVWSQSDDWEADLKRWDWQSGLFVSSWLPIVVVMKDGIPAKEIISQSRCRIVVSGARFKREDICKMVEHKHSTAGSEPSSKVMNTIRKQSASRGRSGPRQKKFNYGPVLSRLETEIANGEISRFGNVSDFGMQAKLEQALIRELTGVDGNEPSPSTARRAASHLMKIWKGVQTA